MFSPWLNLGAFPLPAAEFLLVHYLSGLAVFLGATQTWVVPNRFSPTSFYQL